MAAIGSVLVNRSSGMQEIIPGMGVSMQVHGFDNIYDRARSYTTRFRSRNLEDAALAAAQAAKDLLIADMSMPKGGTMKAGDRVPPSVEGETPAIQSGELAKNTDAVRGHSTAYRGEAFLDSRGKHALWMEFGWTTKDGVVHYRPFHRTFVAGKAEQLQAIMKAKLAL